VQHINHAGGNGKALEEHQLLELTEDT
jgi:hypothetical protein